MFVKDAKVKENAKGVPKIELGIGAWFIKVLIAFISQHC